MAGEARQIVVLGVGNRLRGDDAVGCLICDELSAGHDPIPAGESGSCPKPPDLLVLDCGSTPENYIQKVVNRKPERILFVDCCDYGAQPGEFRAFCRAEIEQLSYGLMSTHTLPLALTIDMLFLQTNANIELLGIQPEQIEFGQDLSEPVRRALPAVVEFVRNWAKAAAG